MSDFVQNCHVDYLGFTIKADSSPSMEMLRADILELIREIFGPVTVDDTGKGWRGYTDCFKFCKDGFVAFGGEANNNTVHFELPGDVCALVLDWNKLADLLDYYGAKMTRCDIAHDDYEGETLSINWARDQYANGGFKPTRGISPKSSLVSDEGHGTGSTYYVGSRLSGKFARIYEKGKQLGDAFSKWVRFEVEWLATHRVLSTQMLRDPSSYLSGSYPCAGFISGRIQQIKTVAFKAAATLEKAKDHAVKQAGGFIAAMRELGHTAEEIIQAIAKPLPSPRLALNVQALKAFRSMEKPDKAPAWYRPPTEADKVRIKALFDFDLSFWRAQWAGVAVQ